MEGKGVPRRVNSVREDSVQRACVSTSPWAWAISGGTALQASGLGGVSPPPLTRVLCVHTSAPGRYVPVVLR